jgi:hypothetical protein
MPHGTMRVRPSARDYARSSLISATGKWRPGGLHSAETDGGFESGIGTTQGVVLREDPGVTPVYDKCRDALFDSLLRGTGSVVAE